ncbi:LolA family protein [Fuerstiella marisgermanici]|nr:hypothetical protein [Fuerstiella marisgermanici]
MINRSCDILILTTVLLFGSGCQTSWFRKEPQYVDPALPMSYSCHELVDYLNRQNQGLNGWRSTSTVMTVRLPNGLRPNLKGVIACQSPNYFRLTAENIMAEADLGSNASRCWMYSRPGDPAVLTWRHEDTALLQQIPTGMPYIDPKWLMLILGITPLDANDYELTQAPQGTHQLWLLAIEDTPHGRPIRRVIKVDTLRGVVREHVIFDSESHTIARATLSQHQLHNGHFLPGRVKLEFPATDSEITLTFKNIDTNPHLPDELWRIPARNMQVVDLGDVIRSRSRSQLSRPGQFSPVDQPFGPPKAALQPPEFGSPVQSAFGDGGSMYDGSPSAGSGAAASEFDGREIAEPNWDTPISFRRTADENGSFEAPAPAVDQAPAKQKPRGFFNWWK